MSRAAATVGLCAALVLAAASPAAAANFYVDDDTGSDANPCTSKALPCASVTGALNRASSSPGSGDTVGVDGGDYNESLELGDGNSLGELDFNAGDGDTEATISGVTNFPAIRVMGGDEAGTIEGFTLRAQGAYAVALNDSAVVTGNTFDAIEDGSPGLFLGEVTGSPPVVSDNVLDALPGTTLGIGIYGSAPTVSGNELRGLSDAIEVGGGSPTLSDNTITGLTRSCCTGVAHGIRVQEPAAATIRGNVIRDPDGSATTVGIEVASDGLTVEQAGAELERNRILGQDIGIRLADTNPVSLSSDLIAGNGVGLAASDSGIGPTDVAATNLTVYDNGTDIRLADNQLALDSSIVESPIADASAGPGATCTITHSRGPTTTGNGCQSFQTVAGPGFVKAGAGNYHLRPTSPMVDQGNPAPPGDPTPPPAYLPGSMDVDGDPRALDGPDGGSCSGSDLRRDIGADELDCVAPQTIIDSGPSGTTNDPTPTLSFHSSEANSKLQCKVDGGAFTSCASPRTLAHLNDGSHAFSVRARDAAGNLDPTPAARSFTVRTAAVGVSGSRLVVTAAPGAKDNLRVSSPSASVLRVTDSPGGAYTGSGLHTGPGCTRISDYTVSCNASQITLVRVDSGDQTDQVVSSTTIRSSLKGGAANDVLTGGPGNDTITGGRGADAMKGMNGDDLLVARDLTSDTLVNCDRGTSPGAADKADLDLLPTDPDSVVVGCETKTRH